MKMCKIGPNKTTQQTTVTSYYVTVVFDLPRESVDLLCIQIQIL